MKEFECSLNWTKVVERQQSQCIVKKSDLSICKSITINTFLDISKKKEIRIREMLLKCCHLDSGPHSIADCSHCTLSLWHKTWLFGRSSFSGVFVCTSFVSSILSWLLHSRNNHSILRFISILLNQRMNFMYYRFWAGGRYGRSWNRC